MVLEANPLEDITNTRRIEAVYPARYTRGPSESERRLDRRLFRGDGATMKHAHTISWVLFALLGAATVALSLSSVTAAYLDPSAEPHRRPIHPRGGGERRWRGGEGALGAAGHRGGLRAVLRRPVARNRLGTLPAQSPALPLAAGRYAGERTGHPAARSPCSTPASDSAPPPSRCSWSWSRRSSACWPAARPPPPETAAPPAALLPQAESSGPAGPP